MPITISGGADPDLVVPLVREQDPITVSLTSGGTVTITALPPLPVDPVYRIALTPSATLTAIGAATQARVAAIGTAAATQFLAAVVQARSAQMQAGATVSATGARRVSRQIQLSTTSALSPVGATVQGAQVEARDIRLAPTAALSAVGASTVSRRGEISVSGALNPVGSQVEVRDVQASTTAAVKPTGAQVEARSAQPSSLAELQPVGGRIVSRTAGITANAATSFVGEAVSGVFSPASLFAAGEQGAWFDPSDLSTLFQDGAGTTAVTADGDPVGFIGDKSGNGNHATQNTSAARPVYRTDGTLHWLEFDGVDDGLRTANGVLNTGTVTTVCGVNTGGNRATVWGLPHEANNHTDPYFRFSLFRAGSSNVDIRVNGSNKFFDNISIGDNVFYLSSSDAELRVNANVLPKAMSTDTLTYPNSVPFLIGQNAAGGENLSGKFYGFFGVDRSLTSVEIGDSETYMGARTGVTI